jgi:hypothetical protein
MGSDNEDNLWLACRSCRLFESHQAHGADPVGGGIYCGRSPENPRPASATTTTMAIIVGEAATLGQMVDAHQHFAGLGDTGEVASAPPLKPPRPG